MESEEPVIKSKQASKRDRTLKNLHRYYLNDLTLTLLLIHHPFLNVKRHQGASNMQKVPICTRHRDRQGEGGGGGGGGGSPTTYSSLPMGGKLLRVTGNIPRGRLIVACHP